MLAAKPAASGQVLRIGERLVGGGAPVFIIAEIGLNHDGSVERAKELIDRAIEAGADSVKFQMRTLAELYVNGGDPTDPGLDLGCQYTLDILRRSNLSRDAMFEVFRYAIARGVICLCTPCDLASLRALIDFGLPALKVASSDLTNHELLDAMIDGRKPLLVSTGMSREGEIRAAVRLLRRRDARFALLHCVSAYPPALKDLHLRYLQRLWRIGGGCPVGYSGHERGWTAAVAAVALGAQIIEKHVTLDRTRAGIDHKVSLLPHEFADMVRAIRDVEDALGTSDERYLRHGERINRQVLAKSLVARHALGAGQPISRDDILVRCPGQGLQPDRLKELVGRPTRRAIAAGTPFFESDLGIAAREPRHYRFRRPWGVPVRYHDFAAVTARIAPDFVEFHLSDKDLDQDPDRFLRGPYRMGFVVHSPELFSDDLVLDLASGDDGVRRRSVHQIGRVVALARALRKHFPSTPRPMVIANMGGASFDAPVAKAERHVLYDRLGATLAELDLTDVELVPQTLPPFPWHFGGQRFGNLLGEAYDAAAFCERYGYRLCLDIAHTYMASVYHGATLAEYCELLAPLAAHLHLSDAGGYDREGLQIGEGEIDFAALAAQLDRLAPAVGFIPEIWEGHCNMGEGFWTALDRLEPWFGDAHDSTGANTRASAPAQPTFARSRA